MRRSPMPPRKAYLERSKKPLPKLNVRRATRKRDREAQERKSPEWRALRKQVRERSGGRCERTFPLGTTINYLGNESLVSVRCPSPAVDVHHLRYTKVRTREALTDLLHVCRECHAQLEAQTPYRASRRSALARAAKGGAQ